MKSKDICPIGPLTPHPSLLTSSVAFCYSRESRAVARHPRSKLKELMAHGAWSDKKDKAVVSTKPSAFSLQPRSDGTGLADDRE